jgi:predicted NBD/HSP70 family sugar kinase
VTQQRERQLLRILGHSAGLTRAELSRHIGVSKATVSGIVGDLVARGVLTEKQPSDGVVRAVGRPGTLVRLAGPERTFAALLLSAEDLRVALCDFAGATIAERTVAVPAGLALDELVATAAFELAAAHDAAGRDPALTVGAVLSLPAPFQPGVGLPPPGRTMPGRTPQDSPMWAHARWLSGDPVPVLAERFGLPVLAENDANLAALGEVVSGAGKGHSGVAYVKLTANTIGMGLVLDGRIHRGASGFAGELAHIQVDPNGPLCHCGGRGCLRGLLGTALLDAVRPAYDRPLNFDDVLALAVAGELGPRRILDDLGRTLGRALADFCTLLNPSAIIIDGGLGEAGSLIADAVENAIIRHSAPHAAQAVQVRCGSIGKDSELYGARELLTVAARGTIIDGASTDATTHPIRA